TSNDSLEEKTVDSNHLDHAPHARAQIDTISLHDALPILNLFGVGSNRPTFRRTICTSASISNGRDRAILSLLRAGKCLMSYSSPKNRFISTSAVSGLSDAWTML